MTENTYEKLSPNKNKTPQKKQLGIDYQSLKFDTTQSLNDKLNSAAKISKQIERTLDISILPVLTSKEMLQKNNIEKMKKLETLFIAADNIEICTAFIEVIISVSSKAQNHLFSQKAQQAKISKADTFALSIGKKIEDLRKNGRDINSSNKELTFTKIAKELNINAISTPSSKGKWSSTNTIRTYKRYLELTAVTDETTTSINDRKSKLNIAPLKSS